nr:unnamed protein product [Digitaria exilis]
MSHGLGSGTATTIPCSSGARTTWQPRRACLLSSRFLDARLVEPLLRDVDLALGGARVDVLEAVGGRLDEPPVGERAEKSLTGEANHFPARAVGIDGEDAHDAVGDLGGCGGGGWGSRGGGRGHGTEGAGERGGEVEREAAQGARRDRHG